MSAAFYKTGDPAVLNALAAYEADVAAVRAAGVEFAKHFGGRALFHNDAYGVRVAGIRFAPVKDGLLWTKAAAERAGMQQPRASLRKSTKEQRAELAALQADWAERFPKEKADLAPVLAAMGTDWGSLLFCGLAMFQHDGAVYASTSAKLAPCMVEILSSEYSAAKAASESAREVAA